MLNKNGCNIKFNQLATEWLQFKKTTIKESTYLNYQLVVTTKFSKEIGTKTISELLDFDFNSLTEKLTKRLARKTVRDIVSILKSILRYAELKYDVNFKLALISVPSNKKKEVEIFTERERKRIETYCFESDNIKDLAILISLYTGLRVGEVCALKWEDIDFEHKWVHITHTLQRVYIGKNDTKVIYTTPKTNNSFRKIPLSKVLLSKLKQFNKQYPPEAFILSGKTDKWIEPIAYRYSYKAILKSCRVKYKNFHVLRHTFATRCMKVGMDIKSLSEILGHASVNVTLNIYVHSSFEMKNKFINRL